MAGSNGTGELTAAQRKRLTSGPIGNPFDPYGTDRLFASYDDGKVFDYPEWHARDMAEMLSRDGKARTLEQVLTQPILSAPRKIIPGKGDTGEAALAEELLYKPALDGGMSTPFDLVLAQAAQAAAYRATFFEKVFKLDETDQVVYDEIAWRPPATCMLARDPKSGKFAGFRQQIWYPGGMYTTSDIRNPGWKDIPANRAYVYLHDQARDPLHGASALDVCYWAYETKMKLLFLWLEFLENQALPKVVTQGRTPEDASDRAYDFAQLKNNGVIGLTVPQGTNLSDLFAVLESAGRGGGEFANALRFLESWQSQSVLAGFTDLTSAAAAGRGSFALSSDQSDFFLMTRQAAAKELAASLTHGLLADLVRYNRGAGASYPRLQIGPLTEADSQTAVTLLQALAAAPSGTILPSEFIDELAVKVAGYLDLDVDKVRQAITSAEHKAAQQAKAAQAQGAVPPGVPAGTLGQVRGATGAAAGMVARAKAGQPPLPSRGMTSGGPASPPAAAR